MHGDFEKIIQEFADRGIYLQEAVLAAGYVISILANDADATAHFKARWTQTVTQIPWMVKTYVEVSNDGQS